METEDIDLSSTRRWMKEDMTCSKFDNIEILKFLLGKNKIVTCILEYNSIFKEILKKWSTLAEY